MGLLTSLIQSERGNQFPYAESIPAWAAVGASSVQNANNVVIQRMPRLIDPLPVAKVRLYVIATSGNLDVGVYTFDGTTWTLQSSSGSTAVGSATTVQTVSMLTTYVVQPGVDWYIGLSADNTTATFQRTAAGVAAIFAAGPVGLSMAFKASSFPLATNATSFVAAGLTLTNTFAFWLRASEV